MRRELRLPLLEAVRDDLSRAAYAVLDVLARMARVDGELAWPCGTDQLARETRYCARTIGRARKELLERGLIEVTGGGANRRRYGYRIIMPAGLREVRRETRYAQAAAGMSTSNGPDVHVELYIDPRARPDPAGHQQHPSPTPPARGSCGNHPTTPGNSCRACGTSPRHHAANPRASGTNPRAGYVTPIPPPYVASPRPGIEPPAALLAGLRERLQTRRTA